MLVWNCMFLRLFYAGKTLKNALADLLQVIINGFF